MNFKKMTQAAALACTLASTLAVSGHTHAAGMFDPFSGTALGNICRTGAYYSFIGWNPVGATCWNYMIGTPGVVSTW